MADFSIFFPKLLKFEGGWVNDPSDNGGCTNWGVTLPALKAYRKNPNLTCQDVKTMAKEEAGLIAKKNYWDKIKGDNINSQSVAEFITDWGYNSGIITASKKAQTILGVDDDGIIGQQTIDKINASNSKNLFDALKRARIAFVTNIVNAHPTQSRFLKGWLNRINSFIFND